LLQNRCQKMQGGTKQVIGVFRYWIWKLVNLLQNHETRWVSTRGVKQVKWVLVLRFHISEKLTL
jgi:hypothetical protein